jgi:hypothetical protein
MILLFCNESKLKKYSKAFRLNKKEFITIKKSLKIKTMKKTFKLNSNFLSRLKNFWFAMQLLIVSVSLPVLSIVEMSHSVDDVNSKHQEEVIKNSANQNPVTASQNTGKTIKLS